MLDPNLPPFQDIETPALVLDFPALLRNIAGMAAFASAHGIGLRPHAKTHKSPAIAQRQLEAGARGIACATVAEIEAFAKAGIPGLLLTSPVTDRPKLHRLARVARDAEISIVVDHADQIEVLRDLLGDAHPLQVLVDIDVGQRRTGVCDAAFTLALARLVAATPGMRFAGIPGLRRARPAPRRGRGTQGRGRRRRRDPQRASRRAGGDGHRGSHRHRQRHRHLQLRCRRPLYRAAGRLLRVHGCRLRREGGGALPYEPSLFILATVTSVNRAGEFTIDAGVKAMAFNGPAPELMIGAPEGSTYRFGGDEHGMVTMPGGAAAPRLGSRMLVLTTHCDPTVNLHPEYHVVGHNNGVETWPVLARYGY